MLLQVPAGLICSFDSAAVAVADVIGRRYTLHLLVYLLIQPI